MSKPTREKPDQPPADKGRRRFCQVAIGGMAVVTVGTVGYPVVSFLRLPKSLRQQDAMKVDLSELPEGGAAWGEHMGRQIVVIRIGDQVRAFDGACPHLGCVVQWDTASHSFLCPCHGATFNDNGEPTGGPVNAPLKRVEFAVADDLLELT